MQVLVLEPDRLVAQCIREELERRSMQATIVTNADEAIVAADQTKPDAVISELSLPGHSGSEFLYEFRTYPDWQDVPVIVYSSLKTPEPIAHSKDWQLLGLEQVLYKPTCSLQKLADAVEDVVQRT